MLSPDFVTPLAPSAQLHPGLYFKLETTLPTGSYKDRFIAAEIAHLRAQGKRVCLATSSGNTGSSLAAHCARFGLACVILVNDDAPAAKLLQMQAHGARVLRIPAFASSPDVTASVFSQLECFTQSSPAALVVSAFRYCPIGMQGVKTIARELIAQLPQVDHVFAPVGSGGLFIAVSEEMKALRPHTRVHAVQPAACPTLFHAFRDNAAAITPVTSTTRISGLSVPFDIDASLALRTLRENHGHCFGVSDDEVFAAQRDMLRHEGIYAEPAGAAALAGYRQALAQGLVQPHEHSVCLVTGHGSKDLSSIEAAAASHPTLRVAADTLTATLTELLP